MIFRKLSIFAGLALATLLASQAGAQSFVLEFGRGNDVASDGSTFSTNVDAGTSLALNVYLTQIAPEARLNDANSGLAIADVTIDVTAGGTMLTPVSFTFGTGLIDDTTGNSGVTGQSVRIASVEQNALGLSGATTSQSPGANSVLIGTINYDVGAGATGTFVVTAQPVPGGFSQIALADPVFPVNVTGLTTAGTANIVVGIPEPSSFALLGLGVVYTGYRYRRRQTAKPATDTPQQA